MKHGSFALVAAVAATMLMLLGSAKASAFEFSCNWSEIQSAEKTLRTTSMETATSYEINSAIWHAATARARARAQARAKQWTRRALVLDAFSQEIEGCAEWHQGGYPAWREHMLGAASALELEAMSSELVRNDVVEADISLGLAGTIMDPSAPRAAKTWAHQAWMRICADGAFGSNETPEDCEQDLIREIRILRDEEHRH
jgi:hypothetical protein